MRRPHHVRWALDGPLSGPFCQRARTGWPVFRPTAVSRRRCLPLYHGRYPARSGLPELGHAARPRRLVREHSPHPQGDRRRPRLCQPVGKAFPTQRTIAKNRQYGRRLPMKFTIDWLKEHLDTDASVQQIVDTLTMTGTEVEQVQDQAAVLADFTVCEVISAEKHPNADRLKVCLVNTGEGDPVRVVCGAPNAKTGMKGVFAAAGTYIPGTDFVLQKGVIRGEESNGMLCSERELMLSDDHDGIIELPADAPVGQKYVDYANISNVLIEVEITPNRGDCVSVRGIARELAAAGLGTLKDIDIPAFEATAPSPLAPLEHRFAQDEPRAIRTFAARVIQNVKNGPSPDWLQKHLLDVGLRPINAIVDVTNYISLGWGRPLHAYDVDRLTGQPFLRNGHKGETFEALDGKRHELDETMCVIADESGAICLGGIMGGVSTGCTQDTTSVLLESATWDPMLIAKAGRKTGIVSDARFRLERSVDPALTLPGLDRATALLLDMCGGEACQTIVSGHEEIPEIVIDFPWSEVKRLTGLSLSKAEIR
ncbi:MAG TPA: phenylalanine--tRNA ligase subunit beta, partial [Devosia sp.]|nr:phenylalanine--tRNA ligase subunit beta [Devosia sp.]